MLTLSEAFSKGERMPRRHLSYYDLERSLDRDAEREPSFGRGRRLPRRAYLYNTRLADIAAGLYDEPANEEAGVIQPPVKGVA